MLFYRNYLCSFKYTLRKCYSSKFAPFEKTIYALCSGQGKCGVAVIRVSGKYASVAIKRLTPFKEVPEPRYAHLTSIRHPITEEILDRGLLFWFPGPGSFTGEDVCEFQVHGGTAIVLSILRALDILDDFRLATPGEFTKRAFYNNKMDLVEAEGLADLINAETELQRKQAFMQSRGVLSKIYNKWKDDVYDSLMNFEGLFNFETMEELESEKKLWDIVEKIEFLNNHISEHLSDNKRGERLRLGVHTVILGEPNVGKSSLYNFLCNRNAAIVTPYPGTTRDTLQANLDVLGYPVILYDTCGVRYDDVNPIEAEGVKIALDTVNLAQLLILVIDLEKYIIWRERNSGSPLLDFIKEYVIDSLKVPNIINVSESSIKRLFRINCIVLLNKVDKFRGKIDETDALSVSVKEKMGLDALVNLMGENLREICAEPTVENPAITNVRHRTLLENAQKSLSSFLEIVRDARDSQKINDLDYGLLGNDLRYASKYITEIIEGRKDNSPVVDVLDEIFRNFCVGK